jgi:SAM-dependent methyltransferase
MDPPPDLGTYYPKNYYSFATGGNRARQLVTGFLCARRDRSYYGHGGVLGRALARLYPEGSLISVARLNVGWEARILDVGCGGGNLLRRMAAIGYKNLAGVDPLLPNDISTGEGPRVRRDRLEALTDEKYDLVMFHHSLEHMGDPKTALRAAARLLPPGGRCLVRLPVVAHAWEKYGTNWVQLDPPRHIWLPTEGAMRTLAESAGLSVERVEYDSTDYQFWGSELNTRDVPVGVNPRNLARLFRKAEIARFRERAAALNRDGRGDQAVFRLIAN